MRGASDCLLGIISTQLSVAEPVSVSDVHLPARRAHTSTLQYCLACEHQT